MAKFKTGSTMGGRIIATEKKVDEKVESHVIKKDNPHQVTKEQVGLGNVKNYPLAPKSTAEAGVSDDRYMSPLNVRQNFEVNLPAYDERVVTIEETRKNAVADTSNLDREVAYLKLMQDAEERIEGGILFGDDFKGNRFGMELIDSQNVYIENGKAYLKTAGEGLATLNDINMSVDASYKVPYGDNLVKMDNGWYVAGFYNDVNAHATLRTKFYVSKDDGETWSYLGFSGEDLLDMTTDNNYIYALYKVGNAQFRFRRFQPSSIPATREVHNSTGYISSYPLSEQSGVDSGSIAVSPNGTVYVALSSKRPTVTKSFNITLLTSSNNGSTWFSPSNVTNDDVEAINNTKVRVIASNSSYPTIYYVKSVNNNNAMSIVYLEGGGYGYVEVNNIGNAFVGEIDVVSDTRSYQHVVYRLNNTIYYFNTTSNGKVFYMLKTLGEGTNPAIQVDKDNNILVSFLSGGRLVYRKSTDGGSTFEAEVTIGSASEIKTLKGKGLNITLPNLNKISSGVPVYYGQKFGTTYIDMLEGSLTYTIAATNFIGLFAQLKGIMGTVITVNGETLETTVANTDELKGTLKLTDEEPITLKINLNRPTVTGKDNDYLGRILGGRS